MENDNRCVCCGEIIPEGLLACPGCFYVSQKKEKLLIDAKPLMQNGWHLVRTGESNQFLASMSLADVPIVDAVEIPDCNKCAFKEGIAYWHQCENCLGEARNNFVSILEVNKDG